MTSCCCCMKYCRCSGGSPAMRACNGHHALIRGCATVCWCHLAAMAWAQQHGRRGARLLCTAFDKHLERLLLLLQPVHHGLLLCKSICWHDSFVQSGLLPATCNTGRTRITCCPLGCDLTAPLPIQSVGHTQYNLDQVLTA